MPWSRAIRHCRNGKIHGIIAPYKSDVPDFIFPNNPVGKYGFKFYTLKDYDWTYNGLASLKEVILAITANYSYGQKIDNYIKQNPKKVDVVRGRNPLHRNIQKLLLGRCDVLISTDQVFEYVAQKMDIKDQIKEAGTALDSKFCYIAFSPSLQISKELADQYEKGIKKMRKNGKLKEILSKYGLSDWK